MATVLVTVLVLGVFIPVVQATTGAANEVRAQRDRRRLPEADATRRTSTRVREADRDRTRTSSAVQFVSKKQAYAQRGRRNPEAYELLGSNPLPDTFRVTPGEPDNIGADPRRARARGRPPAGARSSTRDRRGRATARRTRRRSSRSRAS